MTARRILILLLMWLIPLYPVLAGTAMPAHQPESEHASMASMHHTELQASQDCCQGMDHAMQQAQNAGEHCNGQQCISHCAISLIDADSSAPVMVAGSAPPQTAIHAFSSITLEPLPRPPSLL